MVQGEPIISRYRGNLQSLGTRGTYNLKVQGEPTVSRYRGKPTISKYKGYL